MGRPARPWFRRGRGMWYGTVDGKQTPLGVTDAADENAARVAWAQLVEAAKQLSLIPPSPSPARAVAPERTVAELVEAFMRSRRGRPTPLAHSTMKGYVTFLGAWVKCHGPRVVSSLTAEEVEASSAVESWSVSTRNSYLGTITTCLRWGRVALDRRVERPAKESRGAAAVVGDDQFLMVLGAATGDFRAMLRVLRETGGRPQEVAGLTAEVVNWQEGLARLREHKGKRHGGDRVLHFNAAAVAVLAAQRARYGSGLLFRNDLGGRFGVQAIVQRMLRVAERVGFPVTAYGLGRHSFATKALSAGVPDTVVAALLGHRSTAMVHMHYSHLAEQSRVLKAGLDRVNDARLE